MAAEASPQALSIAELYDEVDSVLTEAFPRSRTLWVRGEIQHLSDRTGHCYMDLVDPEDHGDRQAPVLKVKCWRSTWGPLRSSLEREGIWLEPGSVVVLRGTLDFYRARAEVGFILAEVDVTALLGRLAAQRAALIRTLRSEGLFERNRALPLAPVPWRVGLVASPGTEGYNDLLGQLELSGWGFKVLVAKASVQGPSAPTSLVAGLERLRFAQCDLVVVVRGGGSKADLAAFDHEGVARAIATMPVPVWTGIGHSGDESVADLVAHRACVTPTECGRELAAQVSRWWEGRVVEAGDTIGRAARRALELHERHATTSRTRLAGSTRHQLRWHHERLVGRAAVVGRGARASLEGARERLEHRAGRLAPLARTHLNRGAERAIAWRRLLAAYDIDRVLERGFTVTLDQAGQVVRSATQVAVGGELVTRLADGTVRSAVISRHLAGRTEDSQADNDQRG